MRLRHTLGGPAGMIVGLALFAGGCSSGHQSARPPALHSTIPDRASTTTGNPVVTAAVNPKQAAIALGQRMLEQAALPAGARPSRAPAPNALGGPSSVPAIGNLVEAHRLLTVNEDPRDVYRWLEAHRPPGFGPRMTSTGTDRGVRVWGVEYDLTAYPPNITEGALEYGIVGDASGHAVVRVDTVVHIDGSIGKRVVTSDPKLVRPIVRAFNQLRVSAPDSVYSCPAMGSHTVTYRVAFAASSTTTPRVVATIGECGSIGVTVGRRPAPALGDHVNADYGDAVAHVLGLPEPHFG